MAINSTPVFHRGGDAGEAGLQSVAGEASLFHDRAGHPKASVCSIGSFGPESELRRRSQALPVAFVPCPPSNSADADPTGFRVAVLGYGNQGRAHALNLRDAGATSGGQQANRCSACGSRWVPAGHFEAAVTAAELVIMALPDEVHGSVWSDLEVHVPHGCSVGFIHGFPFITNA